MPTPEEGMAVILAGARPTEKQKLAREVVAEKRNFPTLPPVAQRRRIESEIIRKTGHRQHTLNTALVEMYDELVALNMLGARNAD